MIRFRDYVDTADRNRIQEWLAKELTPAAAAAVQSRLLRIEQSQQWNHPKWVKELKRDCRGLLEVRVKADNVQCRPLFAYGPFPGAATLLMGATEKNDRWDKPRDPCPAAQQLKSALEQGEGTTVAHRFGKG